MGCANSQGDDTRSFRVKGRKRNKRRRLAKGQQGILQVLREGIHQIRHSSTSANLRGPQECSGGADWNKKCEWLTLVVTGRYAPQYWLVVEANADATLWDLDDFLRDIWVECCGHLSMFRIGGMEFSAHPEDSWNEALGMNVRLRDYLQVGLEFYYLYDFGNTELKIRVADSRVGKCQKAASCCFHATIHTTTSAPCARATRQPMWCSVAGTTSRSATRARAMFGDDFYFSGESDENGYDSLTDEQRKARDKRIEELTEDNHISDGTLPVCNSPRMGVCGYEGSSKYPDQFVPDKMPKSKKAATRKAPAKTANRPGHQNRFRATGCSKEGRARGSFSPSPKERVHHQGRAPHIMSVFATTAPSGAPAAPGRPSNPAGSCRSQQIPDAHGTR